MGTTTSRAVQYSCRSEVFRIQRGTDLASTRRLNQRLWTKQNESAYPGHSTEMEKFASSILFHCANTASSAPTISAIHRDTTVGTRVRRATKSHSQILTSSPGGSVGASRAENGPSRLLDLGLYMVQETPSADRTFLTAGFDLHQVPARIHLRANGALEWRVLLLHPLQGLEFRDLCSVLFFHLFGQLIRRVIFHCELCLKSQCLFIAVIILSRTSGRIAEW